MRTPAYALLMSLALGVVSAPAAAAKTRMRSLKHIVLDPGHGGTNPGAPSVTGLFEKYLTLPIALEVERRLRERTDATVTLTRRSDTSIGLRERTRLANEAGGDVFISIHCNSSENPEANGVEVYFLDPDAAEAEFDAVVQHEERGEVDAAAIHKAAGQQAPAAEGPGPEGTPLTLDQVLLDATMYKSHERAEMVAGELLDTIHRVVKVPRRKVRQAAFAVLKEAVMPAVVLEVGYLSHVDEGRRLADPKYQERLADGIVEALIRLDKTLATH